MPRRPLSLDRSIDRSIETPWARGPSRGCGAARRTSKEDSSAVGVGNGSVARQERAGGRPSLRTTTRDDGDDSIQTMERSTEDETFRGGTNDATSKIVVACMSSLHEARHKTTTDRTKSAQWRDNNGPTVWTVIPSREDRTEEARHQVERKTTDDRQPNPSVNALAFGLGEAQ